MAAGNGKKRVTFSVSAPEAREVCLAGSFNGWDPKKHPMKSDGNGCWKAMLMLPPGTYEYRLVVDGEWKDDPSADRHVANSFGSSNAVREVRPAA